MELRALTIQACNKLTEDMCRQEINNITVRVEEVSRRNGGHIEHLIHRGQISTQHSFFCMLISTIVMEITILLRDRILCHFVRHVYLTSVIPTHISLLSEATYMQAYRMLSLL
jgi:hypothetical protein